MTEISCDMCIDLMPLVSDGVASEDSRRAVEEHIAHCESCRTLYKAPHPPQTSDAKIFAKLHHKLQIFCAMVLMFSIFLGLNLTSDIDVFYNCLFMPLIGVLGYRLFRWRALFEIPLLLFIVHFTINTFNLLRGVEYLHLFDLVFWTLLYCLFTMLGSVIAGLLHFAFKKEDRHEKES